MAVPPNGGAIGIARMGDKGKGFANFSRSGVGTELRICSGIDSPENAVPTIVESIDHLIEGNSAEDAARRLKTSGWKQLTKGTRDIFGTYKHQAGFMLDYQWNGGSFSYKNQNFKVGPVGDYGARLNQEFHGNGKDAVKAWEDVVYYFESRRRQDGM